MNRTSTKKQSVQAPALATRERLSVLLLIAIAFSIVAYAFLVNITVLNIVEKQHMSSEINNVKQNIAELEVALIEQESALTIEYAQERGFRHISTRNFVTRDTNLSLRNE